MRSIVGFSANPEILVHYDLSCRDPKVPADVFRYGLSGTSADVAIALNSLGIPSVLLASAGVDPQEPGRVLLEALLAHSGVGGVILPVREATSQALLPIDQNGATTRIIGKKWPIVPDRLEEGLRLVRQTASQNGGWRVATGVWLGELELVRELYANGEGKRVLNPNAMLMSDQSAIRDLLETTDFLVCNEQEFQNFKGEPLLKPADVSVFHDYGVKLAAVTCSSRGAVISWQGQILFTPAVRAKSVSEVGAGDWWLGGFLAALTRAGINTVDDLTRDATVEAARFASLVAGIKVTKPGANNGPSLSEVESKRQAVVFA